MKDGETKGGEFFQRDSSKMGGLFSANMEENFKRNQDFISQISKIKMERQIQLQYQMKQRELAMQLAKQRESCNWYITFYVTATVGLLTGFRRTKRPYLLAPLVPLTFFTLYQLDLAYGNKIHRIKLEAENIIQFEQELLQLPCDLPTVSSIEQACEEAEERRKLHPVL